MSIPFVGVTFLNHSCISISSETTEILCDPWFEGSAFGNGWRLLCEESHRLDKLNFDYLWISHEHPDHFSIPTLRHLPDGSQVIYQKTQDQKVKRYLESRHSVIELADLERRRFRDIEVQLFRCDGYDSAMSFRLPTGQAIVNVNDCRVELGDLTRKIRDETGGIDLLAMQFSYANWAGNRGDNEIPRLQHQQVISRIRETCTALKPNFLLLFASYVYFSHEENFYWNEHSWLREAYNELKNDVSIIIPTPGYKFDIRDVEKEQLTYTTESAINFWENIHNTRTPIDKMTAAKSKDDLVDQFGKFFKNHWASNDLELAKLTLAPDLDIHIHISDLNFVMYFNLMTGESRVVEDHVYDISVSSEMLSILFTSSFGRGTATISGRIQFNYPTAFKFFTFFFIFYANNNGRYFKNGGIAPSEFGSIAHTAVLANIFRVSPEGRQNYEEFAKSWNIL